MPKSATRPDRLREAHERLTQAVESIVTGDDWARMLKVASKFHRYSLNNQLLIFLQRPDAMYVAGFRRWADLNRWVRKGEKGIAILAPCKYKVPSSNGPSAASAYGKSENQSPSPSGSAVEVAAPKRERRDRPLTEVRGFRVVHVFDISQTDGEPLDDLDAVRPELLDGAAPDGLWDSLVSQAETAGFNVIRNRKGSENGYCDLLNKEISVRPDVSDLQGIKTLVHELAHALLHADDLPRTKAVQETEVESVAYVVLDALGITSDSYSFAYVARWSDGDVEAVRDTAARVTACASSILKGLEQGQS